MVWFRGRLHEFSFRGQMKCFCNVTASNYPNEFHFGLLDCYEFISGSLKLWHCKKNSFHPEIETHVNGLLKE